MSLSINDFNNAALDLEHIAALATSTEPIAVDRLGNVKKTLAGAIAVVDAGVAQTAAGQASLAKAGAEAARDAAIIGAGLYVDEPTGRAAVADGMAFKVQGGGDVAAYEYRRTSAAASALIASYPSVSGIKSSARDLFRRNETEIFPFANLAVRRYTSANTFNDYAAGYSQTATGSGVQVAIPASGSGNIKHFIRTGVAADAATKVSTVFTSLASLSITAGIGFGYRTADGVYIGYVLSKTGNLTKITDFGEAILSSGLATYADGATLRYEVEGGILSVFVNGTLAVKYTLGPGEFDSELLFVQAGFGNYVAKVERFADPIRAHVSASVGGVQAQVDNLAAAAMTTAAAKTYARDLFKFSAVDLFPAANLPVRRYTAAATFNDYAAGYSQSAVVGGLRLAVPASGTTAITHYARTGKQWDTPKLVVDLTLETAPSGAAVGIGYISSAGEYIQYALTTSGVLRKTVNYTASDLTGILSTYSAGAALRFILENGKLAIYCNGAHVYSYTLSAGEFQGELLIAQRGFPAYVAKFDATQDSIRDYVSAQISAIGAAPSAFYSYNPTGSLSGAGLFKAFVKVSGNTYVGFEIGHEVNMADLVYVDYWRIEQARIYVYNGTTMVDTGKFALTGGESECVWKRSANKDDFTGGYHGDEIAQEVLFFASGVKIDPARLNAAIALTPCSDFSYLEKSTMHATAEGGVFISGHPVECHHIKQTHFRDAGYETFNRLTWDAAGLVTLWYHGIACVAKDTAAIGYTDDAFAPTTFDGANTIRLTSVGEREMRAWNATTGYSSYVTSTIAKPSGQDANAELFVNDRSLDSKYYRKQAPVTVAVGDIWESVMRVSFATA